METSDERIRWFIEQLMGEEYWLFAGKVQSDVDVDSRIGLTEEGVSRIECFGKC